MNWITNVREPKRLILAWQQADDSAGSDRTRRAVAEVVRSSDGEIRFSYLEGTKGYAEAVAMGFEGYPAFKLAVKNHVQGVLPALMRRLPPRSRPDFQIYLEALRIAAGVSVSDFALLAASEAKLPSDGFSLVDSFDDLNAPAELVMEVAGYRHNDPDLSAEDVGREVYFVAEPDNRVDGDAVKIMCADKKLGYVNTIQAPQFKRVMNENSVTAWVERLNGKPGRPRAFVFVVIA